MSRFVATAARVSLAAATCLVLAACTTNANSPVAPPPGSGSAPSQLLVEDLVVGTGQTAVGGRFLTVDYTGWVYDDRLPENKGSQFDSSIGTQPFSFPLGVRAVVAGWDQGLVGMRVGGMRRLTIPPDLGYGADGVEGRIPGNATLLFEITLLGVQ